MSFPNFYDREKVGTVFSPQIETIIKAADGVDYRPAQWDEQRILLLLIDPQVDFIHENGALSVPGAVDDTRRTIEWLFDNLEQVTDIVVSLDSHNPLHIFFPGWWVDAAGNHPDVMTPITSEEVNDGRWQPLFEEEWSRYYVRELERKAKKTLLIWPYHTLIGTIGHAITPALYEAITYHAEARRSQPTFVIKGRIPITEHYSILEPEVKATEDPEADLNTALLERMLTYDRIYIAGQAKSHCVLETVTSIVNYADKRAELIRKLHLLSDCMSSVIHPDIDFDALADEAMEQFAKHGLQQVNTSDPVQIS